MPVLRLMLRRWVSTVRTLIPSVLAICLLLAPSASMASTSFSRCDNNAGVAGAAARGRTPDEYSAAGQNRFYGREQFRAGASLST